MIDGYLMRLLLYCMLTLHSQNNVTRLAILCCLTFTKAENPSPHSMKQKFYLADGRQCVRVPKLVSLI